MSDGVSNLSTYITSISLFQGAQNKLTDLSNQLETGKKSTSLTTYGAQATTVLNLSSSTSRAQSYIANANVLNGNLSAYDTTLSQLSSDSSKLNSALSAFSANDTGSAQTLSNLVTSLQQDVTATLNTKVGDRYIYAGSRYGTAPVQDLTNTTIQPLPTTPTAFTAAAANAVSPPAPATTTLLALPAYDTQGPITAPDPTGTNGGAPTALTTAQTQTIAAANAQQTVSTSDQTSVTYGVTSNDPSIQQLVYALQNAAAAANAVLNPSTPPATTATINQFIGNAQSASQNATTGIENLRSVNADNQTAVTNEQSVQKTALTALTNQASDLESVDSATVATQLTAIQTQLDATYKVTSSILQLSILKYIS